MKDPEHHMPPGPSSRRRQRPIHLGLLWWEGFLYPELYLASDRTIPRLLAKVIVVLTLPLMVVYLTVQRCFLAVSDPAYRGQDASFRNSSGPHAYCHVAMRRLGAPARSTPIATAHPIVRSPVHRLPEPGAEAYVVIDDFYDDPDLVRSQLLSAPLDRYEKGWFTTALSGGSVHAAARELARVALANRLGLELAGTEFNSDCGGQIPGWNGALHLKLAENWLATDACCIHNHANLGDSTWTGIVYLNPTGQSRPSGTELLYRKANGRSVEHDQCYDARVYRFGVATRIESVYNRLLLFPSGTLHCGEPGFGHDRASGRAFQTLFFRAE